MQLKHFDMLLVLLMGDMRVTRHVHFLNKSVTNSCSVANCWYYYKHCKKKK